MTLGGMGARFFEILKKKGTRLSQDNKWIADVGKTVFSLSPENRWDIERLLENPEMELVWVPVCERTSL